MASDKLCCPFCAAEGRETSETDSDYPSKRFMFIQCSRCGARTASIYGSGDPSEWAEARSNWNTRITSPTATDAQGVGEAPKAVADDSQYFWRVELFHRGDTGNSLGRYHTGFTDLSHRSRSTENVYEAKRYADKATAERVSAKLMESPALVALEWRAVEHGFMATHPTASTTAGLTEDQLEVLRFLWGAGNLRGCGFGTKPKEELGLYWWRAYLAKAFPNVRLDGGAAE